MKVKRIASPDHYSSGEYEPADAPPPDDYGKADEVIYWYSTGDYCGAGQALVRKGKQWAIVDNGHCSCYGPWDAGPVYRDTPIEVSRHLYEDLAVFNKPKLFKVV